MATWGMTNAAGASNSFAFDAVFRMVGGTSPNLADMQLDSISLYFSGSGQQPRIALYTGGTAADPTGATLVEDLGQLTINGSAAFYTINSTSNPTIPQNAQIWIAVKHGTSGPTGYLDTNSANRGDLDANGRDNLTGVTGGTDQTVAFPATLDGTDSFAGFYYPWYLTYSIVAGPTIDTQPVADVGLINGDATRRSTTYTVEASGDTFVGITWNEDGSPISDGGIYDIVTTGVGTGTLTSTLTITRTDKTGTPFDIDVDVEDAAGTTASDTVTDTWYTGPVLSKSSGTTNGSGVDTLTIVSDYPNADGEFTVVTATAGGVTKEVSLHYDAP